MTRVSLAAVLCLACGVVAGAAWPGQGVTAAAQVKQLKAVKIRASDPAPPTPKKLKKIKILMAVPVLVPR